MQKFTRASAVTEARLEAVAKRLRDLGGGDVSDGRRPFREELQAVPHWPFLAGRVKPDPGRDPFRLSLEQLLGTRSKMGDVLEKLGDLYAERGPAMPSADQPEPTSCVDAWAEAQAEELAARRARWAPVTPKSEASDAVH